MPAWKLLLPGKSFIDLYVLHSPQSFTVLPNVLTLGHRGIQMCQFFGHKGVSEHMGATDAP